MWNSLKQNFEIRKMFPTFYPLTILPIVAFKIVEFRGGKRTFLCPKAVDAILQDMCYGVLRKDYIFVEVAYI